MVEIVAKTGKKRWYSGSVKALLAVTGTNDPVEAMRFMASSLIDRCEFDGPPIDGNLVASMQGVHDVIAVEMHASGMLVPLPAGGFRILINRDDTTARQNFS